MQWNCCLWFKTHVRLVVGYLWRYWYLLVSYLGKLVWWRFGGLITEIWPKPCWNWRRTPSKKKKILICCFCMFCKLTQSKVIVKIKKWCLECSWITCYTFVVCRISIGFCKPGIAGLIFSLVYTKLTLVRL